MTLELVFVYSGFVGEFGSMWLCWWSLLFLRAAASLAGSSPEHAKPAVQLVD